MHDLVLSAAPVVDVLAAADIDNITAEPLKDLVVRVLGSLFVAFLVWRLFTAWAKTAWGLIILEIVGAVLVSVFVLDPDGGLALLGNLRERLTGA